MRNPTILIAMFLCSSTAHAETLYYRYDVLGRLTNSYSDLTGYRTDYSLDATDNRTQIVTINTVIVLQSGESIQSPDGRFRLTMQLDGNLVLYGPTGALWAANTVGSGATFATMQSDGNLVLYTASNEPIWASNTANNPGAKIQLQNDGNLVIYNYAGTPIWDSNTGGH